MSSSIVKLYTCSMRWSRVTSAMYADVDEISPGGKLNNPCTGCGSHQLWRIRLVFDTEDGQCVINFCCDCLAELIPNGVGLRYAGKVNKRYKLKKFEKISCVLCGEDPRGGFWVSKYDNKVEAWMHTNKSMVCEKCMFEHVVLNTCVCNNAII